MLAPEAHRRLVGFEMLGGAERQLGNGQSQPCENRLTAAFGVLVPEARAMETIETAVDVHASSPDTGDARPRWGVTTPQGVDASGSGRLGLSGSDPATASGVQQAALGHGHAGLSHHDVIEHPDLDQAQRVC